MNLELKSTTAPNVALAVTTAADGEMLDITGRTILLVEDNKVNQRVATKMLEKLGCIVKIANNEREALELVEDIQPDAILMDCQMPLMDGFEATERIRQLDGPIANVPIIALTANAMVEDRDRCLRVGMDDYLSKPIRPDGLLLTLSRFVLKKPDDRREDIPS